MTREPGGLAPLVAVEGVDGAGKNTLTTALTARLEARGMTVGRMAFPRYGHRHADLAADALYGRVGGLADSPQAMALLFALDRAEAAADLDRLRRAADVVVLDRYTASNAAYTSARLGPAPEAVAEVWQWVHELEFVRLGVSEPALQVLLATPVAVAAGRATDRAAADSSRARDRYERDAEMQAATSSAYAGLAESSWASPWLVLEGGEDPIPRLVDAVVATTPSSTAEPPVGRGRVTP